MPGRVIVTDVPIEQSILPTTRPYTSAFGLDDNILDVPRNVTIISREQLDSINISERARFLEADFQFVHHDELRRAGQSVASAALPPTCSSTASAAA